MPRRSSRSSSSSRGSSSVTSCSGQFHTKGAAYDCWRCSKCGEFYCYERRVAGQFGGPRKRGLDRRYAFANCYGRAGRKDSRGVAKLSGCGAQLFLAPPVANPTPQPDQPDFPDWDPKRAAYKRKKKEDNIDAD